VAELLLEIRGVREASLRRRVTRFTLDLETATGQRILCHLHDPGRLRHLLRPGVRILYKPAWRPGRRTTCDTVAIWDEDTLVLENTRLPNKLLPRALHHILPGYQLARTEARINGTRVDFIATAPNGATALIEVKATNLVENDRALFPDAPSRRAARQVETLAVAARAGAESHIVFTILRPDAEHLQFNRRVDPRLARLLCANHDWIRYHAYTVNPVLEHDKLRVFLGEKKPVKPC